MPRRPLACWWDDLHVATITAPRPWDLRLRYTAEAQARWPANVPLLSCSLPVQRRPLNASNFLRGLLPEGRHLQALADLAGIATNDVHGMLARYGRDVAGALVIVDADDAPDRSRWKVEPYTDATLEAEVLGLDDHPLGVHDDSELSLPGLQDKLLLVELPDGQWARPMYGHPSTHILKVDDARFPGLVAAEADCLRLAHALGLAQTPPRTLNVADIDCIIVQRYDRVLVGDTIERLHQEDACQALDVDPAGARGRAKYEDEGGPSLRRVAQLLRAHGRDSEQALEDLLREAAFTLLIGNADAHGKNISILHERDGTISLAPVYDTVPTVLWPRLRRRPAMSISGRWSFDAIGAADLAAEAETWGLAPDRARTVVIELAASAAAVAPDIVREERIHDLVQAAASRLLRNED
jgi:serine/threonine-protein kinase HipA